MPSRTALPQAKPQAQEEGAPTQLPAGLQGPGGAALEQAPPPALLSLRAQDSDTRLHS